MKSQVGRLLSMYISLSIVLLSVPFSVLAYDPPIGIPEPSFGIDETHRMYEGQFFAAGGFVYRDTGNGPYTHYVDSTAHQLNHGPWFWCEPYFLVSLHGSVSSWTKRVSGPNLCQTVLSTFTKRVLTPQEIASLPQMALLLAFLPSIQNSLSQLSGTFLC